MIKIKRLLSVCLLCCTLLSGTALAIDNKSLPILMYHHIAEQGPYNSMTISPQRFRDDMQFLSESGFTPLLTADLVDIYEGRKSMPARPVMIIFDDGYESNYTLAYPILKETKMRASITVIASAIRGFDAPFNSFLTWEECKELRASGIIDIGSHTSNLHNPYNGGNVVVGGVNGIQREACETQEQYHARVGHDIKRSQEMIEEHTGKTAKLFAYPFGALDSWFQQLPEYQSFYVTVTTKTGTASIKNGLKELPRYGVSMKTALRDLPVMAEFAKRTTTGTASACPITVNGKSLTVPAVTVDGSQYVHLRSVSDILAKTPISFSVQWQPESKLVGLVHSGTRSVTGAASPQAVFSCIDESGQLQLTPVNTKFSVDAAEPMIISGFQAEGNSFYPLEDLGDLLGFQVTDNTISIMLE